MWLLFLMSKAWTRNPTHLGNENPIGSLVADIPKVKPGHHVCAVGAGGRHFFGGAFVQELQKQVSQFKSHPQVAVLFEKGST